MFDTSRQGEPLTFLVGLADDTVLKGRLIGAEAGETRSFTLEPEDAGGHPSDALIQEVPRSMFPTDMPIDLGMMLMSDAGPFRIIAITDTNIKCDQSTNGWKDPTFRSGGCYCTIS